MARLSTDQIDLSSGLAITGSLLTSGSFTVTGSANVTDGITGSLFGTASYALTASHVPGLELFQIITGSITASVSVDPTKLFLIQSGSTEYIKISSVGDTTINSDLFIIKNFTTQQPVLTVSQSIVQFATQSSAPTGTAPNGGIWFTSSSLYVGLD